MKRAGIRDIDTNIAVDELKTVLEKVIQRVVVENNGYENSIDIEHIARQALNDIFLLRRL